MSSFTEERSLGEGLSNSLLRVIDDAEKVDWLREILSGFSHRCRNSLNGMKLSFYLCKRESSGKLPPFWGELEQTYELIETTIDRLQLIYRPLTLTLVESRLGTMIAEREVAWRLSFAEEGKALEIEHLPGECAGRFDPMYLGQGLDALVAWRAEVSPVKTLARLSWQCVDGQFQVTWDEAAPTPGEEGDTPEPIDSTITHGLLRRQVDSLALPLLARIIRAHEGRLSTATGPNLSLRMNWPLAPRNLPEVLPL